MKTKTKMLLVVGLLVAMGAGYMIGILVNYPALHQNEVSGTFGKAEKFHKVQMTANDIQLRSELLKDTAKLKGMIQGLVYFSLFTEDVRSNVELAAITFRAKGMGALPGEADIEKALVDYADFIRNNNNTLNNTVQMLTGFYSKKSTDLTQDVEKTMREFGAYVNNINEKNTVLISAIQSMDNFMLTNKTLQSHKEEISQLKLMRDQMLIKGIQFGGVLKNKKQVGTLLSYALSSQDQFSALSLNGIFNGTASINSSHTGIGNQSELHFDMTSNNIGVLIGNQTLGSAQSVVYNSAGLGSLANDQLHVINAQGISGIGVNMVPIASMVYGSQTINVNCPLYSVSDLIHSQVYSNCGSLSLFTAINSSVIFSSASNIQNMVSSAGSLNSILNAIVLSQDHLGAN